MDEQGGFYIEFDSSEDAARALPIVNERIQFIPGWQEAELDDNTIGIYDDSEIEYDDFVDIFEKICKGIARELEGISFAGVASYRDTDTKEEACDRISCQKGKLLVENIFTSHEGVCPECGEKAFYLEDFYPGEYMKCGECGFRVTAADAYGTQPEYEKHEVEIG